VGLLPWVALLVRLVWCPLPPVVDPGHISRDGFTRFARVFRRELKITGAASAFSFVWWWLVPDDAICHGLEAGNGKARHGSGSGWVCGSGSRMSAHSRERTVARPTHRSAAAAARGAVGTYAAADWQCTRPRPLLSCCHLRCACARAMGDWRSRLHRPARQQPHMGARREGQTGTVPLHGGAHATGLYFATRHEGS
jgi:hypothetical protein